MAEVIKMPKLVLSMQKGTIVKWLFKEGERIEKGEPWFKKPSASAEGVSLNDYNPKKSKQNGNVGP